MVDSFVETHATLKKTKYFLNIPQEDKSLDDRLKEKVTDGSTWLVLQLGFDPTATDQTELVASQYAAGLWEQINAQDKTKDTRNMQEAKENLIRLRVNENKRTFPSTSFEDSIDPIFI